MTDSGAVFNRGDYLVLLVTPLLQPSVDLSVSSRQLTLKDNMREQGCQRFQNLL